MGNNPISTIDPDGRCVKCPDNAKVGDAFTDIDGNSFTYSENGWGSPDGIVGALDAAYIGSNADALSIQDGGQTFLRNMPKASGAATAMFSFSPVDMFVEAFFPIAMEEIGGNNQVAALALTVASKGKVKPTTSASVAKNFLLAPVKTHKHHVLPQQFRSWFSSKGINNIDDYAVEISQKAHLKGVHGNGYGSLPGKWNQKWRSFIKSNDNATQSQIFNQAENMLSEFGLEHLPYIKY